MAKDCGIALVLLVLAVIHGTQGQAQVYAPVGDSASVTIQLPDQNTNIISPSGQTMIEVGFFGDPTVSQQYRNRVTVTNYSGGFGTPSISFTFRNVQLTDGGNFQCTSTFGGNTRCGPTLVVLGRPTLPQLTVTPNPVVAGRDVEMACAATSTSQPPSASLILVYVLKQDGNVITQPRTSSFLIKGISAGNAGTRFQCAAYELNTVTNRLTGLESGDSEVFVLDPQYAPAQISVSPNQTSYTLKRDETMPDIECRAACNPDCDFQWYKAPNRESIVAQGPVLQLGTVTSDEDGTYVCAAVNTLGERLLPVKVEVQVSLGEVTFDPPPDSYTVREGTTVPAILCNSECVPACKFEWFKDGRFLYESDGINFGEVGRADSGDYTCRATNDRGSREKNLKIQVQYPPSRATLTPAALNYELEENAAILPDITCAADCQPDCEVLWRKEGADSTVSLNSLALGTATRADTGRYQCLVRNQYGEKVSDIVNVKIFYSPEGVTFDPAEATYNVEEGTNLDPITCNANCEPACTYSWYKGNDLSSPAVPSATLNFGQADQADAGLWTCVASNTYGSQGRQLRLNIAYGPKDMTLMPPRQFYTLSDTDTMPDVTCSANCNPPCSFSWFKDNDPFPDALNNTLSLGSVARGDEGNYTCRTSNSLDSDTRSLQLVITYGPSSSITLDPPQTRYNIGIGSSIDVGCSAVCDPECSYTWVRDDGMTASTSGSLNIPSVSSGDGGVYVCRASNNVGPPASASITINVLSGPQSLTITPQSPISLEEGNDFVVTCAATCSPACTYTWQKGNRLIASQGGMLPLTDVTRSDAGVYTCEARNSVDSSTGQLQVEVQYGAGESISLIPNSENIKVKAGDSLEVTCVADCYPQCDFKWFQGTNEFSSGAKLVIPTITEVESGPYTCIAQNSANSPAFSSTFIDVVFGPRGGEPEIFPPEPVQSTSRGSSFQARCSADCNPDCDISWFFGSREIPSPNGILNLRSVTAEDAGVYSCRASNSVDSATQSFTLQVQAGPGTTIKFTPPGATQEVIEGRPLSVSCSAECSPPCSFYWQTGSRNVSDSGDLNFDPIQRDDGGIYVCYASNDLDSLSSKQLEVKVMYGPEGSTRIIPDGTKNLDVGDTLNIVCVADCSPSCQYTWYLGQQEIPSSNGEVKVDSVSLRDSGTYSCQANNGVGARDTKSVSVFVQSGPGGSISFNPPNDTVTLTEGNTLQVTCSAQCTPACYYVWSLGQREIPSVAGVLSIPGVSAEQRGDYTCVAANGDGNQASKVLSVDVLYGPGNSLELVPDGAVQTLNEGASLQISCRSMCNPPCEHQWYFVTTPLNTTNGVLSLVSLSAKNEGNYKCVAFNGVGRSKEKDVLIKVQTGPGNTVQIVPDQPVYQVNEGNPLQLQCDAVCSPACTYTWYFGGTRIRATDGIFLQDAAKKEDAGPYVCYAANEVAVQGSRQIQVDVLYGPTDQVKLDPPGPQRLEVGDMLTVRCSASCKPDCQYRWFKGNSEVYSEGGRLVVGPATEASKGDYSCQAYNKVDSQTSDVISIEILKPPGNSLRFTPPSDNPSVVEGSDIEVLCEADCIPECEVSWWRGQQEVQGTYLDGTLRLKNVSRDEIHFYTCYAANGVGSPESKLLVLEVLYGPQDVIVFPPEVIAPLGGSVSLSCQTDCNPPCELFWLKGTSLVPSQAGILTLKAVEAGDAGNYSCSAGNQVGTGNQTVPVTVITGGGAVVQFDPPDTSVVVSEGQPYSVRCQSRCAPECEVLWTRDGAPVPASAGHLLQFTSVERGDKGVYSCMARNSAGTDISQLFSLDVTYGPGTSASLIPPVFTRTLSVGDSLVSRCEADCSPSCEIVWLKDGNLVPGIIGGDLLVSGVTASDAGLYRCVADNRIGAPGLADLTVTVAFGPVDGSVTLSPPERVRQVLEGEAFTVTCMAECLPMCTYTWYVGNFKYQASNGSLVIDQVSRRDAGTYTCHADNGVGQTKMLDLQLVVQYPPQTPSLAPATIQYRVSAGVTLPDVTCSADCSPQCAFSWLKDGQLFNLGSQLSLGQASREDVGSYTCTASNFHGETEIQLSVNVDYEPVISLFTVRDRKFSAVVKEGLPVKLSCEAEADPAASLSFYNGSQIIYTQDSTPEISYAWPRASCFDAGSYFCVADNGVGNSAESKVDLEVLCSPRLDPRIFKQPYVASQIGGTAVITVPVVADPTPSFLWYKKQGSGLEYIEPVDGKEESERFFYVNGTSSTLVIRNVQQGDFGDYIVSVANTQGTDNITFGLVTEGPPYKPGRLSAVPVSPGVVELTWLPGFNGGDAQQFVIEFMKSGSGEWRRIDKTVMDRERMVQANITDLHPLSEYTFRIRGLNGYGYSNYSDPVVVVTQDDPEASRVVGGDVSTTPVLLGVGCALGFLVGAGITAMVVVSRCKPKPGRHNGENTIDDYKSDTTYDTLYLKDALWAQRHIKLSNDSFKSGVSPYTSYDFMQQDDTQVRYSNPYTTQSLKPGEVIHTSL